MVLLGTCLFEVESSELFGAWPVQVIAQVRREGNVELGCVTYPQSICLASALNPFSCHRR